MARPTKGGSKPGPGTNWLDGLSSQMPVAGLPGPGRWLVLEYLPTSLFSLKPSQATSSVGRSLLVPTPYAMKMSFVDVAFRTAWLEDVSALVEELAKTDVRVGVPERATVTHTIGKIRQEPKDTKRGPAYIPAVAYREFVHYSGVLRWAFDMESLSEHTVSSLLKLAPAINYIGKRGSFIQFLGASRLIEINQGFTQPLDAERLRIVTAGHIALLDDFGPGANLDALNSYSSTAIKRDRDRRFVQTLVPLEVVNVGPGFTEYASETRP